MSASTRSQRATIYAYVGHNDEGYTTAAYGESRGTYWCRLSAVPGDESMLDHQAEVSSRAVIELADEVPVAEYDLVVINNVQWRVGPIAARPAQRAKLLRVERSNKQAALPTGIAAALAEDVIVESGHTDEDFDVPTDQSIDGGGAAEAYTDTLDGGGT